MSKYQIAIEILDDAINGNYLSYANKVNCISAKDRLKQEMPLTIRQAREAETRGKWKAVCCRR